MPQKPDAEQFAKVVLWHLSGLRADIGQFRKQYLAQLAAAAKKPLEEFEAKWKAQHDELRNAIYKNALQEIGLDDESEGPPTFRR